MASLTPMWSDSVKPASADQASPAAAVLDNVVFTSLMGPHDRLAQRHGRAVRYLVDISRFAALPDRPQQQDWSDLARLVGNAEGVALVESNAEPPEGWIARSRFAVVQMVDDGVDARTEPGPFAPRTIEMGTYLGFRQAGQLSPWRASDSARAGGPRSARCARRQSSAAADWQHASACACLRNPAARRDPVLAHGSLEYQGNRAL
jgi:hypothetical protein